MNPLVDKALQAKQAAENLRHEAIQALLGERKTIAEELKILGYVEGQKPATPKAPLSDAKKYCKVCQQYGHDGRFHRRKDAAGPSHTENPALAVTTPVASTK